MEIAKLFIDNGLELELCDFEHKSLIICMKVIEYINQHNTFPKITDKSPEVRKLANWLTSMRAANGNKSKRTLYTSVLQLAKDNGYPNLFEKTKEKGTASKQLTSSELYAKREAKAIETWKELNNFIKVYHHYPRRINSHRKDNYDDSFYNDSNRLYHWVSSMRGASNKNSSRVLYPALNKLVKKSKYPNIFTDKWKDDFK